MTRSTLSSCIHRVAAGLVIAGAAACHGILDVSDPTLIRNQDIANANGANGRRINAESYFFRNMGTMVVDVAYFTDEIGIDVALANVQPTNDRIALDQRNSMGYESAHPNDDPHLGNLDLTLTSSSVAIPQIRLYSPADVKGDFLGQLYAYRGFAIAQMAEDICSGFPINDVSADNVPNLSGPYSTDSAFHYALAQLDSAIGHIADSTQFLNLARVVKGRLFLDLGQYDSAAAAVAAVPDSYTYTSNPINGIGTLYVCPSCNWNTAGMPMGDGEGRNGLHFVSEHDVVRAPSRYMRNRLSDSTIPEYVQQKYTSSNATIVLASGTEARLIQAEVALHNHAGSWLTTLNALRAPAGLAPLTDPGTDSARVDLLYHERAFWMYLTGRRLGDLRRLVRNYGRDPESVFPTGPYPLGGTYGTATAIPFSFSNESRFNPKLKTGCIQS